MITNPNVKIKDLAFLTPEEQEVTSMLEKEAFSRSAQIRLTS
jgi:hypothetical protein